MAAHHHQRGRGKEAASPFEASFSLLGALPRARSHLLHRKLKMLNPPVNLLGVECVVHDRGRANAVLVPNLIVSFNMRESG
jgi:hypothetical protein